MSCRDLPKAFRGAHKDTIVELCAGDKYYADELVDQLQADFARRFRPYLKVHEPKTEPTKLAIVAPSRLGPMLLLERKHPSAAWELPKATKADIEAMRQAWDRSDKRSSIEFAALEARIADAIAQPDDTSVLFAALDETDLVPGFACDPQDSEFKWVMCALDVKETATLSHTDRFHLASIVELAVVRYSKLEQMLA